MRRGSGNRPPQQADGLCLRALGSAGPCASNVSAIWSPIRITGLSAVIGSWKIMATRGRAEPCQRPRRGRADLRPSSDRAGLAVTLRATAPSAAWAHIDLPEPDSPTTQRILPGVRSRKPVHGVGPIGAGRQRELQSSMARLSAAMFSAHPCKRGLSASFRPSPIRLSASTEIRMAMPGRSVIHQASDHGAPGADHVAPAHQIGIAEAEKGQRGFRAGSRRNHQRRHHDDRRRALGRISRQMIAAVDCAGDAAAWTYSRVRSDSTSPAPAAPRAAS